MPREVTSYVDKFIKRYHSAISKVCEPLTQFYGVNYFSYHSVSNDGMWRPLVSRPDWADFYTDQQFYLMDPFLLDPKYYQSGKVLWEMCQLQEEQKVIYDKAVDIFNFKTNVILVERSENGCEFFGFTGPNDNHDCKALFFNGVPTLKKFCQYFKEQLAFIFDKIEADPIPIADLRKQSFFAPDLSPFSRSFDKDRAFLEKIDATLRIKLSTQEKICLRLYLKVHRMKDVAEMMRLSPRTVESYLESIKIKLSCEDKSQLIRRGQELLDLGLLN